MYNGALIKKSVHLLSLYILLFILRSSHSIIFSFSITLRLYNYKHINLKIKTEQNNKIYICFPSPLSFPFFKISN